MYQFCNVSVDLASCPAISGSEQFLLYPSTSVIFLIIAVFCGALAVVIATKYNSVGLPNYDLVRVNMSSIRNDAWIAYFIIVCIRALVYFFKLQHETLYWLWMLEMFLYSLSALLLSFAVHYQLKFRCQTIAPPIGFRTRQTWHRFRMFVMRMETLFIVLWLGTISTIVIRGTLCHNPETLLASSPPPLRIFAAELYWPYFSCSVLQHMAILYTTLRIVFPRHSAMMIGPRLSSRVLLLVGVLLYFVNHLPMDFWAHYVFQSSQACPLYFMSGFDTILLLSFVSLLLFFVFLRVEFFRNKEECMWSAVNQMQNNFDTRRM